MPRKKAVKETPILSTVLSGKGAILAYSEYNRSDVKKKAIILALLESYIMQRDMLLENTNDKDFFKKLKILEIDGRVLERALSQLDVEEKPIEW